MIYERPTIIDYGSIGAHTFERATGGTPKKDTDTSCTTDNHGDFSCPSGGVS